MITLTLILASAISILLALPACLFFVQLLVGSWPEQKAALPAEQRKSQTDRSAVGIIVPAHNESANLGPTILSLLAERLPGDRILVVADNCTDDTAEQARRHGAEVAERSNHQLRGKGYALDYGWQVLREDQRLRYFLVVDADCIVHPGALTALVQQCKSSGHPAQALYLCHNEGEASLKQKVSEFAWTVKNWARAMGYARLGLPCQLQGSGMLFPRLCLESQSFASGSLVEDLELGLQLSRANMAPRLCPTARVTSLFPMDEAAQQSQRKRWEHGHLAMITQTFPRHLWACIKKPNKDLLALTLDLAVPPLTLLLLLNFSWLAPVSLLSWMFDGFALPLVLTLGSTFMLVSAVIFGWLRFGQTILRPVDLLRVGFYVLWKIPLYVSYWTSRQSDWIRTKRDAKK